MTGENGASRLGRDLELLREKLDMSASLPRALCAGIAAAAIGAALWGTLGALTSYRTSVVAIAVGILCGAAVRFFGRGITIPFGVVGVGTTSFGFLLGNFLMIVGIIAGEQRLDLMQVLLNLDYGLALDAALAFVGPIDGIFYAIGLYQAYRLSFRPLTEAERTLIAGRVPSD